ncbi:MAG: hypothetical protein ACRC2K_04165 [Clostridium sp.]
MVDLAALSKLYNNKVKGDNKLKYIYDLYPEYDNIIDLYDIVKLANLI